ncbi:MAG: hypothetical protein RIT81_28965 [Deltaproteobacteria bacterium]
MIISTKFAQGQQVRFVRRCVLASNVPRNSQGYKYAALRAKDGDTYDGEGVIEPGTRAVVVDYASHGTGSQDNPIVRVNGHLARTHQTNLEMA